MSEDLLDQAEHDDLIAMPEHRVAELTGLSPRQLRYWRDTLLVEPSISRRLSERNHVRLYTFRDVVSLMVAAELKQRHFSTQHIRRVVAHLRADGYPEPLSELRFATLGREIYFQMPDGTWSGDVRPSQIVLYRAIQLEPIRARIRSATQRPAAAAGKIERVRGRVGSKPVFASTRIPVETVVRWLVHGATPQQVIAAYPDLTRADIQAARSHAASA